MGAAMVGKQIRARLDKHYQQLEALKYSGNRDLALKLLGHIGEAIAIGEIPRTGDRNISEMFAKVTEKRPEDPGVSLDIVQPPVAAPVAAPVAPTISEAAPAVIPDPELPGEYLTSHQE